MGRIIVALSGGKASAWCANWAMRNFDKDDIVLYFNDTKWEHPDLYRFLDDLSRFLKKEVTKDTDGRSPEQLFFDQKALACDRMPFCSRILKAERLQKFYKNGDTIIFGISKDEEHRAQRIVSVYQVIAAKKKKMCRIRFPLIEHGINSMEIDDFIKHSGIEEPILYKLGFSHNNCSGGCVRQGKRQWKRLYDKLPDVYADRERVERRFRKKFSKDVHFLKDITLEDFRIKIEKGELSGFYYKDEYPLFECVGICNTMS